jgi:hypothetical protein
MSIVNSLNDETFGATAGTIQHGFKTEKPIHGILATMHFLQDGATLPTISHMVTQFGSELSVKAGGKNVFSLSVADLHHLLGHAMPNRIAVHQSDGTGADNHVMSVSFPIPLGPFAWGFPIHPDFGVDPSLDTVSVKLDYPADANNIDGRELYLDYITLEGKKPKYFVERITRNYTAGATGWGHYVDLPYGRDVRLLDHYFWMTSSLAAGTTTDATSIEQLSLELNQTEKYLIKVNTDSLQFNAGNLSLTATSPEESLYYLYAPTSKLGEIDGAIPLIEQARYHYYAGVADAIRCNSGVIRPL